jgi:uncharacterized membrane protein YdbT with pleckstrin-like domain
MVGTGAWKRAFSMNELVRCTGRLHGIIFWLPVLLIVPFLPLILPLQVALLVGTVVVLLARLRQKATKIILTNRRAIIKRGMRRTTQINLAQIESIDVVQPYLGIIFNYGTITICGAGGRREQVDAIADPVRFREQYD